MILALICLTAHAGAFNDWTGPVKLPGNTASLAIHSVEGDVTVTVDPEATDAVVEATDFRPGRACVLETVKDKRGRTALHFGPKDLEDPKECRTSFAVTLPPQMALTVELGIGEVRAVGMDGDLSATVAKGDVRLTDHDGAATVALAAGDLHIDTVRGDLLADVAKGRIVGSKARVVIAHVGEGKIQLSGLAQAVQADTGVGDILLAWTEQPEGALMLNAGNGHVVVDLPDNTQVSPRLSSMTGTTTCELPEGDGLEVVAVAGMGSVRVH